MTPDQPGQSRVREMAEQIDALARLVGCRFVLDPEKVAAFRPTPARAPEDCHE